MTPALRRYRAADRAEVTKVYYRAVHDGAAAFYDAAHRAVWAPSDTPDPDKPDKLLQQFCLVACDADGRILGFMSLEDHGHIDMAFVLPEVMGQGVAATLYEAILKQARAEGHKRLTVEASHLARRFFARRGWKVEEAQNHPHGGLTFERFVMACDLAQEEEPT